MVGTRASKKSNKNTEPEVLSPTVAGRPPRTPRSTPRSTASRPQSASSTRQAKSTRSAEKGSSNKSLGYTYSSDEVSDSEDSSSVVTHRSARSVSSARSASSTRSTGSRAGVSGQGFSLSFEKQLLQDIEDAGGLVAATTFQPEGTYKFGLEKVLSEAKRPHLYGQRGDATRKKISQRIKYLKSRRTEAQYLEYLALIGVTPYSVLQKQKKVGAPTQEPTQEPIQEPVNQDEDRKPRARSSKKPKVIVSKEDKDVSDLEEEGDQPKKRSPEAPTNKKPQPEIKPPKMSSGRRDDARRLSGSGPLSEKLIHIPVNTEYPEDNREVYIFKLDNVAGVEDGSLYYGYWIVLPIDLRWVQANDKEDFFKARLWTTESVHIRYPAWPYSLIYDRAKMQQDEDNKLLNSRCMVSADIARNAYLKDQESRKWKNLILDFPEGHELSAKDVNPDAGENDELELDYLEFEGDGDDTGCHHFATWIVVRKSHGLPNKSGAPDLQSGRKSKAALLREKMRAARATASDPPSPAPSPLVFFNLGPKDEFMARLDQTISSGQKLVNTGKHMLGMGSQDTVMGDEGAHRKRSATESTEEDLVSLIGYMPEQYHEYLEGLAQDGEKAQYNAINKLLNERINQFDLVARQVIMRQPTLARKIEVLFNNEKFREAAYQGPKDNDMGDY